MGAFRSDRYAATRPNSFSRVPNSDSNIQSSRKQIVSFGIIRLTVTWPVLYIFCIYADMMLFADLHFHLYVSVNYSIS